MSIVGAKITLTVIGNLFVLAMFIWALLVQPGDQGVTKKHSRNVSFWPFVDAKKIPNFMVIERLLSVRKQTFHPDF